MLLSLLETILVMHLMAKDAVAPDEDKGEEIQNNDCGAQGRFCFHNCQKGERRRWQVHRMQCRQRVRVGPQEEVSVALGGLKNGSQIIHFLDESFPLLHV